MKLLIQSLVIAALLAGGVFIGIRILREKPAESASMEHGEAPVADYERGPHGGRLLAEGDFALEVTIYEPDIPPQFRVFPFEDGEPLPLDEVSLVIELHRFGGRVDRINFAPRDNYLVGDMVVEEPHSFDVKVIAQHDDRTSTWEYESYEGRVEMSDESAASVGLEFEKAEPRTLETRLEMIGRIVPNEDAMAKVTPRFPGIVIETEKRLGERVGKGELLAVVESNQSLTTYEITAPIDGIIIERDVSKGGAVGSDKPIYVIADLSTVWVELQVRREDYGSLEEGREIHVTDGISGETATATLEYFTPFGSAKTQTLRAIASLPNPDLAWRPGILVRAEMVVEEREVPVAVRTAALQTFRDWDVVFMKSGDVYEIGILELGRRDGDWIEVTSGIEPGTTYVSGNAFVVKADTLKDGASHDH